MRLEELDLAIPEELIAQEPAEPRDSCRLMHLEAGGERRHRVFSELPSLLRAGDVLVFNDSKVLPARVQAQRLSGGKVELLFLHPVPTNGTTERWEALARPSHRLRLGEEIALDASDHVVLAEAMGEGRWLVSAKVEGSLLGLMQRHGRLPLPPYIRRYPSDPSTYQTVYAAVPGSAAAPTAGLHFTQGLLEQLRLAGVEESYVTLHVGLDTFQPIREQNVEDHKIHREAFSVSAGSLADLRKARSEGRRLVAVGTTATRVLETLGVLGVLDAEAETYASQGLAVASVLRAGDGGLTGSTQIYITPGHRFRVVDALLTNFHLPHSTVLALTMAFSGVQRVRQAYAEAVAMRYRFYSFGDAMLVEAHDAQS